MPSYCEIKRDEMASILEPKGFKVITIMGCYELVWELPFKDIPRLSWRVFSSLTEDGRSRGCGKDAIRVVVWDTQIDKPIMGSQRTNRVPGWEERLKDKIHEIGKNLKLVKCPKCGAFLRKRKGRRGFFLGCTRFPDCRHTQNA